MQPVFLLKRVRIVELFTATIISPEISYCFEIFLRKIETRVRHSPIRLSSPWKRKLKFPLPEHYANKHYKRVCFFIRIYCIGKFMTWYWWLVWAFANAIYIYSTEFYHVKGFKWLSKFQEFMPSVFFLCNFWMLKHREPSVILLCIALQRGIL